jgi:hypothetical protein
MGWLRHADDQGKRRGPAEGDHAGEPMAAGAGAVLVSICHAPQHGGDAGV